MPDLTDREQEVLEYVAQHIDRWGFQPSYREIAEHLGWASAGYVTVLFTRMENRGVLARMGLRAIEFQWKNYLPNKRGKHATHHAQGTDGSRHRDHARRHVR